MSLKTLYLGTRKSMFGSITSRLSSRTEVPTIEQVAGEDDKFVEQQTFLHLDLPRLKHLDISGQTVTGT